MKKSGLGGVVRDESRVRPVRPAPIPEDLQEKFVMEVSPVLDHLLVLLKKYEQMCPETMRDLDDEIMRTMEE